MAELNPPTPAFREGSDGHHIGASGSARLTTTVPWHLRSRGFIPTWPARAVVHGVAGVPSDATVPDGTTVAQNTLTGSLYVKRNGVWQSVNGEV